MNCGDDWTGGAQHVCALGDKCSNKIVADRANLVYHHDNGLFRSLLAALECGRRAARPSRASSDRRPGRAFRYCAVCRQLNHVRRVRCTACGAARPRAVKRAARRRRAPTTSAPRALVHDVPEAPRADEKTRVQSDVALLTLGRGDGLYEVLVDSVLISDVEAQCVPTNPLAEISFASLDALQSADALRCDVD